MISFRKKHPIVKRLFKVFLDKKFQGTYINQIYQEMDTIYANIHLPEHKESSDLEKLLPNLKEEVGATAVKLGKINGKSVQILFGMRELSDINFSSSLLNEDSLKVKFPSAYGEHILDFEDGSSCHLLNGGATRMGKTVFLLYLATTIYLQNKGNVGLYISSAKLKDYYPFEGLPNVKMGKDIDSLGRMLKEIIDEYKKRDALLYSPSLNKATDAKSVRKLYPHMFHHFKPIFLIIDEFGRVAESKEIQRKVTEIVETAGFVNIHVIIASQRPDAREVLKPRIKTNLLARLAFTTVDKKNSEIILDIEGAEKLRKIAGRGMLIDSDVHTIQVPYLDVMDCYNLLEPHRGKKNEEDRERFNDTTDSNEVQSSQSESSSILDMQGQQQPSECSEPSTETYDVEWLYQSDTKGKG